MIRGGHPAPRREASFGTRALQHAQVESGHGAACLRYLGVRGGSSKSRPRSGYYVLNRVSVAPAPRRSTPRAASTRVLVSDLVFDTLEATRKRDTVPLGSAFPSPTLFPWAKLARYLGSGARRAWIPGARWPACRRGMSSCGGRLHGAYLGLGMTIGIEQIIITAGALEALNLSLQTVTRPGDTIAVESPTFYGCLLAAERLRLNVVEISTDPGDGVDLEGLNKAIAKHPIRACWFMTTLHHPTGATTPRGKEARIGAPAHRARHCAHRRRRLCRAAVRIACSARQGLRQERLGFALRLVQQVPGARVPARVAGRRPLHGGKRPGRRSSPPWQPACPFNRALRTCCVTAATRRHLLRLRQVLSGQQAAALNSVQRHFPPGFRVARPSGGYFLWIECAPAVDALEVHRLALDLGISIAPGPMFSARRQFRNFLRLNCGHPWTPGMDRAVQRLGEFYGASEGRQFNIRCETGSTRGHQPGIFGATSP